jgi:hypothetical protein
MRLSWYLAARRQIRSADPDPQTGRPHLVPAPVPRPHAICPGLKDLGGTGYAGRAAGRPAKVSCDSHHCTFDLHLYVCELCAIHEIVLRLVITQVYLRRR